MNDHNPYSPPSHVPAAPSGGPIRMLAFFVMFFLLAGLAVGPTVESASSGGPASGVSYTRKSYGCPVFLEQFAGSATGGRSLPRGPGVHFYWTSAMANVVWICGASFGVSWMAGRYDRINLNRPT